MLILLIFSISGVTFTQTKQKRGGKKKLKEYEVGTFFLIQAWRTCQSQLRITLKQNECYNKFLFPGRGKANMLIWNTVGIFQLSQWDTKFSPLSSVVPGLHTVFTWKHHSLATSWLLATFISQALVQIHQKLRAAVPTDHLSEVWVTAEVISASQSPAQRREPGKHLHSGLGASPVWNSHPGFQTNTC